MLSTYIYDTFKAKVTEKSMRCYGMPRWAQYCWSIKADDAWTDLAYRRFLRRYMRGRARMAAREELQRLAEESQCIGLD